MRLSMVGGAAAQFGYFAFVTVFVVPVAIFFSDWEGPKFTTPAYIHLGGLLLLALYVFWQIRQKQDYIYFIINGIAWFAILILLLRIFFGERETRFLDIAIFQNILLFAGASAIIRQLETYRSKVVAATFTLVICGEFHGIFFSLDSGGRDVLLGLQVIFGGLGWLIGTLIGMSKTVEP